MRERIYAALFLFPSDKKNKKEKEKEKMMEKFLNKKVIVRGINSGVFFGTFIEKEENEVLLKNCRRIWYWDGAASISQLAVDGTNKPNTCKFTIPVESILITDVIEIIPCTKKAIASIEGVEIWKM